MWRHTQVEDYASRKGMAVAEVERWLRPALSYDVDSEASAQAGAGAAGAGAGST